MALDGSQAFRTRISYLYLLRAVGDEGTPGKLEKIARDNESPYVWKVRDRTAAFIQQRLSLADRTERERWARQELAFVQLNCWNPNFRSWKSNLAWAAEQMHREEKDVSVELLKTRLNQARPRANDANSTSIDDEIPIAATLAAIQENKELLPLLDEWASTDTGVVSDACRRAAAALRGSKKAAVP